MSGEPSGGAFVGINEIYDEMRRIGDTVARLETQLAMDADVRKTAAKNTEDELAHLDSRVSALEMRVWRASGVAAGVGGLLGVAVSLISR